jgi:hypothetical protein
MMFDFPDVIETDLVRKLTLVERVLEEFEFVAGFPRARELMFEEDSEPHGFMTSWIEQRARSLELRVDEEIVACSGSSPATIG